MRSSFVTSREVTTRDEVKVVGVTKEDTPEMEKRRAMAEIFMVLFV